MASKKIVESVFRYPDSDRVRVKFADGNVAFYRGEAFVQASEGFELPGDAGTSAVVEAELAVEPELPASEPTAVDYGEGATTIEGEAFEAGVALAEEAVPEESGIAEGES